MKLWPFVRRKTETPQPWWLQRPTQGPPAKAGKTNLTAIATIVGIAVSVNTVVNGFLEGSSQRRTAFRTEVKSEQDYWDSLYHEYLVALDTKPELGASVLSRKLLALCRLTDRPVGSFKEFTSNYSIGQQTFFGVPASEAADAQNSLITVRKALRDAIGTPGTSTTSAVSCIVESNDKAGKADSRPARVGKPSIARAALGTVPVPPPVTAAQHDAIKASVQTISQDPTARSVVLSAGSPTGWDVDVFWCVGANEATNRPEAEKIAISLASMASNNQQVAPGIALGQIRLRPLPLSRQTPAQWHNLNYVVYDNGPGDRQAANALAAHIGADMQTSLTVLKSSGPLTKWYVSVFLCQSNAKVKSTS